MSNFELKYKKYVEYEIDFEYLHENINFKLKIQNKKAEEKPFWEIIRFFKDKKILEPVSEYAQSLTINCEDKKYLIECEDKIACQVLSVLLNLQNEGQSIYCSWYYYDFDSCNEMPQYMYSFFLADDNTIVKERVSIFTAIGDKCDSKILIKSTPITCNNSSLPLWNNTNKQYKALDYWYYKKFYTETKTGQILGIREKLSLFSLYRLRRTFTNNNLDYLESINVKLRWVLIILVLIFIKIFL